MLHFIRRRIVPAAALLGILFIGGCDTTDAISKYCATSITTVSSVTTILSDMGPSCLREVNAAKYAPFTLPVTSDPNCNDVSNQQDAAIAAAKLLSEYISALNSLSTVGTSTPSTDAGTLATNAAAIPGATSDQKTAISALAQDLTKGLLVAYQSKKITEDIPKAQDHIDKITDALINVIQENYSKQLLGSESEKVTAGYNDFLGTLPQNQVPEAKLILDERWQANQQSIQSKQAAATSAIAALKTMRTGFDTLATNAPKMKLKDIAGMLEPYATELQALIPQMQKAF